MQTPESELHQRRYRLSETHIAKLEVIARKKNISVDEVLRSAIDAYDPDSVSAQKATQFITQLLSVVIHNAIQDTRKSNLLIEGLLSSFQKPRL